MSKHLHYIVSASLGTGIEPTAIAVLEQQIQNGDRWLAKTAALRLRYLERMSLSATYPDIVAQISTLLNAEEIKDVEACGETDVVLDVTGTGRAILELFTRDRIAPIVAIITGAGVQEEEIDDLWRLPKRELVGTLRVVYEEERLKMAESLDLVPALLDELRSFKMRPPRIDPNDPESWREAESDDLVFAVGLACWRASRNVPAPKPKRDRYRKQPARNRGGVWAG